ncbi:MAG: kynureninase [Bacteroidia bacterium]|nr:kynureninase [Bacteroidia bacterium]
MFNFENSAAWAGARDQRDELASFREQFHIPRHQESESVYFCGNSLGLQPRKTRDYVNQELEDWAKLGVEGHFKPHTGWFAYHELLRESTARLVGALPHEVVVMNHLTVNLHLLLVSFYRPSADRYKIICEGGAFPSDRYALQSQVEWHGFDAEDALIELQPRKGEHIVRQEDILAAIEDCGDSLALVMLGGVHYFTGQVLDMKTITEAAHEVEAYAGFDLAHAAGNLELQLHDWNVDFAAWCSYKYLNGGPGTVAGAYVHERHARNPHLPRFAGWWGNDPAQRFSMPHRFVPVPSADSWQLSNAPILEMAALRASMELFERAGMKRLREKSLELTGYLLHVIRAVLLDKGNPGLLEVITPFEEQQQGCQLSLQFNTGGRSVFESMTASGVISDWREPDQEGRSGGVIRVAPVPLYNSFMDVWRFGEALRTAL